MEVDLNTATEIKQMAPVAPSNNDAPISIISSSDSDSLPAPDSPPVVQQSTNNGIETNTPPTDPSKESTPPPAEPSTTEQVTPLAQEPATFNEEEQVDIFNEHLDFNTNGRIKSIDDLDTILEEYEKLKSRPAEPQFKNEAAKRIYEFAKRVDASELSDEAGLSGAQRELRVLGLNLGKMSDREKLFEAFLLDEQNSDLTRDKALELFNEEYNLNYENVDENILTKRKLEVAVRNAEGQIKKMQGDAMKPQSKQTPEDIQRQQEIEQNTRIAYENIERVMSDFEGLAIPFDDNGGVFNYKLDPKKDADKIQQISEAMKNPGQYIQGVLNDCFDDRTNKFDYEGFQAFVTTMLYGEDIALAMLKHGMNIGKEGTLKELKNPPAQSGSGGAPLADSRSTQDKAWDKLGELINVP